MATTEPFQPSAADAESVASFRMVDVGEKPPTRRRAIARGTIQLSSDAYIALREKKNPKGDVLAQAEVAGILAVKRVPETIPLCHSLPIEFARLRFEFSDERLTVTVFCEVGTTAKTGVEMEALAGVNGALLAIYDLSKAVNPVLTISDIRLDIKEGGKSGRWTHPDFQKSDGVPAGMAATTPSLVADLNNVKAAVLVVSDRCARGEADDLSGVRLQRYFEGQGAKVLKKSIVPDEIEAIRRETLHLCRELGAQVLFVTGGTGVSPRDVTPEAFAQLWSKPVPGIGELLRAEGAKQTPMSYLSRSQAGMIGKAFTVILPGSIKAVDQAVEILDPILNHLLHVSQGGDHERRK